MLGWRQSDLFEASGVPNPTIEAFEAKPETGRMMAANSRLLIDAFEKAGLEFIPENGGGAGIRFRKSKANVQADEGVRPQQLTTKNDGGSQG
jgi:hypothetical protein